jgi:hypothetical protein
LRHLIRVIDLLFYFQLKLHESLLGSFALAWFLICEGWATLFEFRLRVQARESRSFLMQALAWKWLKLGLAQFLIAF